MVPKALAVGVAIFASLPCCLAQDVITEDTYFYGESPPVYPSPQITGLGDWADAYSKAKAQVAQLTLDEKINLTVGYAPTSGCSGAIAPIPHIGFKGLCLSDAGNGVRNTDFVSSWPSGIHVGASWNKNLAHRRGMAMGKEAKKKGVNVLLGPVVGPVGRVVLGGRNWEGFSPDPYLAGQLVAESVSGVQGAGVQTSTKHYIGNEQELDRNPNSDHSIESVSSNIDDVTMHELYLWPFQDAVRAGTANIMCSYQRVNNSYGCQNSKLLNGALKEELGFQGYVVTDWTALRSGVGAALAGLDMAMPNGGAFWGANLTKAVLNGTVEETRIDDMATRILAAWYYLKQDQDFPPSGYGMPKDLTAPHEKVEARDVADKPILSAGAVEGHVLLKNIDNTLPLKNPKTLSIFGYSAEAPPANAPNATGFSPWVLGFESALNSLQAVLGAFLGLPSTNPPPAIASNGTLLAGGGSGAVSQSTFMSPFAALMNRADADNTQVWWDLVSGTPSVMQDSDACLVLGNAWASESFDRPGLRDDFTDGLILHVASRCRRTVVVLHNAGVRLVDQWIEHPNVTAVIFAHLPGQETGKALVSLLYGESHFSGKLPYTVAKNESDYGDLLKPTVGEGRFKKFPQSNFTEGVYIDYKHFDREGIEPRFEFGFGLGYTTFAFSNLRVEPVPGRNGTAPYPTGEIIQGGNVDLWDVVARVSVDVTNTGAVDGAEVAQLYVAIPGGPEKQLRGFEKLPLKPGQAATAKFELTRRDLSAWDVVAQKWKLQSAEYGIFVGSSSRQLPLQGKLQLGCKKRRV